MDKCLADDLLHQLSESLECEAPSTDDRVWLAARIAVGAGLQPHTARILRGRGMSMNWNRLYALVTTGDKGAVV